MGIEGVSKTACRPSDDHVTQYPWETVGSIIDIQAALTGAELAHAAVEALSDNLKAIWRPDNGTVGMEFRFWTDGGADNENAVVDVYVEAGEDVYTKVGQLTLTFGTCQNGSATKLFADGIVEAGVMWLTATKAVHVNNNTIGRWVLNAHGYDRFLFIATSATIDLDPAVAGVADDTLHIEVRRI